MTRLTAQEAAMMAEESIQSAIDAIYLSIEAEAQKGKRFIDLVDLDEADYVLKELKTFGFTYQYFEFTNKYRISW